MRPPPTTYKTGSIRVARAPSRSRASSVKYETGSELDIWRISVGNDNVDTSYFPVSAVEMKSKMKSRQALLQAANDTAAVDGSKSFDDLDAPSTGYCSEINAAAIKWALESAPEKNAY